MNRNLALSSLLRGVLAWMVTLVFIGPTAPRAPGDDQVEVPSPPNAEARRWFEDARFGMFVHWGVYSLLGKGEWVMNNDKLPVREYQKLPPRFNPVKFDADEWVKLARAAGMKYITITSKHHDGFCMFDSKLTSYDIVDATPYGKDPIKALAAACHKYKYQALLLLLIARLAPSRLLPQRNHRPGDGPARGGRLEGVRRLLPGAGPRALHQLRRDRRDLVRRLVGPARAPIGTWRELTGIIHELQPGALVGNNHHVAPFPGEDFQMFEQDLPGDNSAGFNKAGVAAQLPLETCLTLNQSWGYNARDSKFKSPEEVIRAPVGASGRGANLLLNVGPRPDGTIGPESTERLLSVGSWMAIHGKTIQGTRRGPIRPQPWGVSTVNTTKPRNVYLHVLNPAVPITIPRKLGAFTAHAFGQSTPLKLSPRNDVMELNLPETARTPVDTIVVLTPMGDGE